MFGFHKQHGHRGDHGMRHAMRHAMRGGRGEGFFGGGFGPGGFGEEGFGGHGGHGGRGGRRRVFDSAELRLVLLKLIADQPRHGYDLIKAIEELSNGSYAPSPGVVYPTLTMLVDMGQIVEQAAEGTKRLFAISDAGRTEVEEQAEQIEALIAKLQALGEERAGHDRSPIKRAMMNLGLALRSRMMRGEGGADLAHDIAAILDEAARKIERL